MYHIASVSFGKDSLAMLLMLLEKGMPLDEVVFYDTGMEFQAIYDIRDQIKPLLRERGIAYTEMQPAAPFTYTMFDKPVNVGKPTFHHGYSWCGGVCRWGTTEKLKSLDKWAESKKAYVYVGIAADESKRLAKERKSYKLFPLADWGMTEQQCLEYCYKHGYFWRECGVRLYDILDRVSCWCCANKNLKELRNIHSRLPAYWDRLKDMQSQLERPMKGPGKSIFDLDARFTKEARAASMEVFSHEG